MNQACKGKPCARLGSSLLRTTYGLAPVALRPYQSAREADAASGRRQPAKAVRKAAARGLVPEVLGSVEYKVRLKGFMKPRRWAARRSVFMCGYHWLLLSCWGHHCRSALLDR